MAFIQLIVSKERTKSPELPLQRTPLKVYNMKPSQGEYVVATRIPLTVYMYVFL